VREGQFGAFEGPACASSGAAGLSLVAASISQGHWFRSFFVFRRRSRARKVLSGVPVPGNCLASDVDRDWFSVILPRAPPLLRRSRLSMRRRHFVRNKADDLRSAGAEAQAPRCAANAPESCARFQIQQLTAAREAIAFRAGRQALPLSPPLSDLCKEFPRCLSSSVLPLDKEDGLNRAERKPP
jgi:hypothetical protein